jgi:hypothetical protein
MPVSEGQSDGRREWHDHGEGRQGKPEAEILVSIGAGPGQRRIDQHPEERRRGQREDSGDQHAVGRQSGDRWILLGETRATALSDGHYIFSAREPTKAGRLPGEVSCFTCPRRRQRGHNRTAGDPPQLVSAGRSVPSLRIKHVRHPDVAEVFLPDEVEIRLIGCQRALVREGRKPNVARPGSSPRVPAGNSAPTTPGGD